MRHANCEQRLERRQKLVAQLTQKGVDYVTASQEACDIEEGEEKIIQRCYKAGMENGWASGKFARIDGDFISEDDCLNENSITIIDSAEDLKAFFKAGNWCLGQGIIFKHLFFLQQVNGGDEWSTHYITEKEVKSFESVSCGHMVEEGTWDSYLERLLKVKDKKSEDAYYASED